MPNLLWLHSEYIKVIFKMSELITSREAQALAKIGSTAFYMAKRFNPKEFPKEHIVALDKKQKPKYLYKKEEVIEFFLIKYPNYGE